MRLAGLVVSTVALAFAAATVLPSVADAQTRRSPSRLTVTPKQSYLYPGTNYPALNAADYAVDLRFRSGVPAETMTGPGGDGGRFNLPQPFELGGTRPLPF
ncbi:hypothetical protein [Blastochloris viridis]|uniref:Uncharacterized protein n=1 Tax=Blastochloris viridis TaxID=1079 RepID=A0A0H5B9Q7_BLAVI|nr:hypothetical protein [Blastochloris viridis]ALK11060.1 hypothetical protein BVIR_3304 [Blastochloris viridis]BAR98952.1 hypothetical protein BV133_1359 [Blastochloris viridis]CUU43722.1 hypothetical protein BVIRIDIS_27480 [Blastochloris viridis]